MDELTHKESQISTFMKIHGTWLIAFILFIYSVPKVTNAFLPGKLLHAVTHLAIKNAFVRTDSSNDVWVQHRAILIRVVLCIPGYPFDLHNDRRRQKEVEVPL